MRANSLARYQLPRHAGLSGSAHSEVQRVRVAHAIPSPRTRVQKKLPEAGTQVGMIARHCRTLTTNLNKVLHGRLRQEY